MPPNNLAISFTLSSSESLFTMVLVLFSKVTLFITKWLSANAVICEMWYTYYLMIIWNLMNFSPTIWAVLPEIPVSISSNIIVGILSEKAKMLLKLTLF